MSIVVISASLSYDKTIQISPALSALTDPPDAQPLSFILKPQPPSLAPSSTNAGGSAVLTDQQIIDRYLPIWKWFFLKKNAMSVSEFERRITNIKPSIYDNESNGEVILFVGYVVSVDWATMKLSDRMFVLLPTTDRDTDLGRRLLPVPRDVFLEQSDIGLVIDKSMTQSINQVPAETKLKYSRHEDAVAAMRSLTDKCNIEHTEIRKAATLNHLGMFSRCTINARQNKCGLATIDLVTGEEKLDYIRCFN